MSELDVKGIQRYDIQSDHYGDASFGTYENGTYVLYADHVSALSDSEALVRELATATKEVMSLLDDYCGYPDGEPYEGDSCPHEFIGTERCTRLRQLLNTDSVRRIMEAK